VALRTIRIFRGERGNGGQFVDYQVDVEEGNVVLDVVLKVQAELAPDLAVRWNCKAGKCGSCSAEVNGYPRLMCMTRMSLYPVERPVVVAPIKTFPHIKDLVTDVSINYEIAKMIPPFQPRPPDPDGIYRMMQEDIERGREFRKCIECFLCQNVCHVIRDHPENKEFFFGPRWFVRLAELEMHPLDTADRREFIRKIAGVGFCNITKCCTQVCPEEIHITDNAIIPLKERVADVYFDPVRWVLGKVFGRQARPQPTAEAAPPPQERRRAG
jgi:succinate dehydrogenase / fumarate reductase iron-sulfur subunit